jgi:class 3 adenylate cyclase
MTRDRHRLNYRPGTVSPAQYDALVAYGDQIDVRKYLPAVTAPTLLLYREENEGVPVEVGEYIAQHMQNARLVRLQGSSSDLYHDPNQWIDELEEFLTGSRPPIAPDRFLAAVLFTDIVASTNSKAEVGDQRWKELLADHHRIARDEFKRHGGTEVNTTGDGFLATFDAPLRAIRCAHEIVEKLSGTDIRIRAGVHAGEIEKIGDDITGLTVDIGSRVAALAGADEVLVSGTVRDMAIGSGITFEERGTHELKGVPGQWRLYAALAEPTTFV